MKTGRDQLIQPVQVHIKPRQERVWGIFYFTFGFNIDIISYYKH